MSSSPRDASASASPDAARDLLASEAAFATELKLCVSQHQGPLLHLALQESYVVTEVQVQAIFANWSTLVRGLEGALAPLGTTKAP